MQRQKREHQPNASAFPLQVRGHPDPRQAGADDRNICFGTRRNGPAGFGHSRRLSICSGRLLEESGYAAAGEARNDIPSDLLADQISTIVAVPVLTVEQCAPSCPDDKPPYVTRV